MAVVTGSGSLIYNDYTGNVTLKLTQDTFVFYFTTYAELRSSTISIRISSDSGSSMGTSFVVILMAILAVFFGIFIVVACVRCCLERRNSTRVDPMQIHEWIEGANGRLDKILGESPEAIYGMDSSKFQQSSCAVCLCDFASGDLIRRLKCSHIFHKSCVECWIKAKINLVPKCPMCNIELTAERPPGDRFPAVPPPVALNARTEIEPRNDLSISHPTMNALNTSAVGVAAEGMEPRDVSLAHRARLSNSNVTDNSLITNGNSIPG